MLKFILFEAAFGYALFERTESEEIGQLLEEVQQAYLELGKFGKMLKLLAFQPFKNAANALEEINSVSEGVLSELLRSFLEMNLPKPSSKKVPSYQLGVSDKALASSIKLSLGVDCISDDSVLEIARGLRLHGAKMLKGLADGDVEKAQLGLGHSYSRAKVKFNVNRVDNMIIQAISLVDQMDKDINTFSMRLREWYSWHFPELSKLVQDIEMYAKAAIAIKNRALLSESNSSSIVGALGGDAELAKLIFEASKSSMGSDISEIDLINVQSFASRVISLSEYRRSLHAYLADKMHAVAPNLAALIGDVIGARLISHAGSLTNLSKYPASTVQILGAEKALFRYASGCVFSALKTKGKTPKYGLIYHSSFIGKAEAKNKGRISRCLANKCSIASRIDCFSDVPTSLYGQAMMTQIEQRLSFFESGTHLDKNIDVMHNVAAGLSRSTDEDKKKKKKTKK